MPKVNFGYAAAALLLFSSWLMMVIAISMPDWSNDTSHGGPHLVRAGLWSFCLNVGSWQCVSVPEPIKSNGFMVTCRVLTIFGLVTTFLANMVVYGAMKSKKLGAAAVCLCVLSFILLSISWGMWIGVHSDYYDKDGLGLYLGSSFIMCCVASAFTMLSIYACIAGMIMAGKAEKHQKYHEDKHYEAGTDGIPMNAYPGYYGEADGDAAPANTPEFGYPQPSSPPSSASPYIAPYSPYPPPYGVPSVNNPSSGTFNGTYPQVDLSGGAYPAPMQYPSSYASWRPANASPGMQYA